MACVGASVLAENKLLRLSRWDDYCLQADVNVLGHQTTRATIAIGQLESDGACKRGRDGATDLERDLANQRLHGCGCC